MTGWSYYYIGIGGEIGYDFANEFANSVPVLGKPFSGTAGVQKYEQSILPGSNATTVPQGMGVKYIRQAAAPNYWWSLFWLGELYPDSQYTGTYGYMNTGNLPAGTTATSPTTFQRVLRTQIGPNGAAPTWALPAGTAFPGTGAVRRLGDNGSTTFFSTGTAASTFHHTGADGTTGTLLQEGTTIATSVSGYNFPLLNPIPNRRPFSLTSSAGSPDTNAFLVTPYGSPFSATPPVAFPVTQQTLFYQNSSNSWPGSGLYSLRDPVTNRVSFVVVNGLSPTGQSGSQFMANWSFLSLIHSFFVAGLYTDTTGCTGCPFRVNQLPRLGITYPDQTSYINNPASVNVTWATSWYRWDGKKYTPSYANTFSESTPLQYQFTYSKDNGQTWFYQDDTPSLGAGVRLPNGDSRILTTTNVTWNTPAAAFPQATYILRVEAYRTNLKLHYSFHQFRLFLWRQ